MQAELGLQALLHRQVRGLLLQQHGPRVREGVHRVPDSVDQAAAVEGLLAHDLRQVGPHLLLVLPVLHAGLDVLHHFPDLQVGAAVQRPLQGADARGDGRVGVGGRGGHHAHGEGGVVAPAVLGVQHQGQVQGLGLQARVFAVGAHQVQQVLGGVQVLARVVDEQALPVEVVPLGHVAVGGHRGHAGDQLDGLAQHVAQAHVVRVGVVGVHDQDAAGQLVHHVVAGRLEDHVLGEAVGQRPAFAHQGGELLQLPGGGQVAEQQQVAGLLETRTVLLLQAGDQVGDVDAAVDQAALVRDDVALVDDVAVHVADLGEAHQHTGTVLVAQAPLHGVLLVELHGDAVALLRLPGQLLPEGLRACCPFREHCRQKARPWQGA